LVGAALAVSANARLDKTGGKHASGCKQGWNEAGTRLKSQEKAKRKPRESQEKAKRKPRESQEKAG